jgi:hypothetical protein
MVKITRMGPLSPGQVPLAPAGVIFRDTKHGLIAQAKPPKRLNRKKPYQFYREREFGWAGRFAANPLPIDYMTAVEMVKGTQMVPRDFLTQCMYGRGYIIQGGPFTNWPNYRDVTNNPQYVLELLDPDIGAMIVRDPIGWVARPPGQEGYVLTMAGGLPQWRAGGGGAGAAEQWAGPAWYDSNASTNNARGLRLAFKEDVRVDRMAIWYSRTSNQLSRLQIFETTGTLLGDEIWDGGDQTTVGPYTGDIVWDATPAVLFEGGKKYWIVQSSPGAALNYRLNTYTSNGRYPQFLQNDDQEGGFLASNSPASGMTMSTTDQQLAVRFRMIG